MDVRIVMSTGKALYLPDTAIPVVLALVHKHLQDPAVTEIRIEIESR